MPSVVARCPSNLDDCNSAAKPYTGALLHFVTGGTPTHRAAAMSQLKIFRALIWSSLILAIIGALIDIVIPGLLPRTVALAGQGIESGSTDEIVLLAALVPLVIAAIVGIVAIFKLKPWARTFNMVVTVVGVLIMPLVGPTIQSGVATAFIEACQLSWGAVLAMAYFSEVSQYFESSKGQQA